MVLYTVCTQTCDKHRNKNLSNKEAGPTAGPPAAWPKDKRIAFVGVLPGFPPSPPEMRGAPTLPAATPRAAKGTLPKPAPEPATVRISSP